MGSRTLAVGKIRKKKMTVGLGRNLENQISPRKRKTVNMGGPGEKYLVWGKGKSDHKGKMERTVERKIRMDVRKEKFRSMWGRVAVAHPNKLGKKRGMGKGAKCCLSEGGFLSLKQSNEICVCKKIVQRKGDITMKLFLWEQEFSEPINGGVMGKKVFGKTNVKRWGREDVNGNSKIRGCLYWLGAIRHGSKKEVLSGRSVRVRGEGVDSQFQI